MIAGKMICITQVSATDPVTFAAVVALLADFGETRASLRAG